MSAVAEINELRSLRVKGVGAGFVFGDHNHGKVLPKWVAEQCGRTAEEMVSDGTMEWTDELPVGDFRAPEPRDDRDDDAVNAMAEELDRLRRANTSLKAENKTLAAESAELHRANDLQKRTLGEQTADIARLKALCSGYETQAKELQASLDEAIAPKKDAPDVAKLTIDLGKANADIAHLKNVVDDHVRSRAELETKLAATTKKPPAR